MAERGPLGGGSLPPPKTAEVAIRIRQGMQAQDLAVTTDALVVALVAEMVRRQLAAMEQVGPPDLNRRAVLRELGEMVEGMGLLLGRGARAIPVPGLAVVKA